MKALLVSLAVVVASASAAAAYPAPRTPCAAILRGRVPSEHVRYWNALGWNLDEIGRWSTHGGAGCWGDP